MEDNTQLLLEGAKGLRSLADALEIAAHCMKTHDLGALLSDKDIQPNLFDQQGDSIKEEKPEEIPLSLIDVRKILAEKSRAGYTEQVRMLLVKYGADKLSTINPKNYKNLADDAACLGASLDDIKVAIEEKTKEGLKDKFPEVFKHHFASSLDDLDLSNYSGFLRDIRRLRDE